MRESFLHDVPDSGTRRSVNRTFVSAVIKKETGFFLRHGRHSVRLCKTIYVLSSASRTGSSTFSSGSSGNFGIS